MVLLLTGRKGPWKATEERAAFVCGSQTPFVKVQTHLRWTVTGLW